MRRSRQTPAAFTSAMTKKETIAVLIWLPVYIWLLPRLLWSSPSGASLSEADVNLLCYGSSFLYMLFVAGRFLRRDFDPLCDAPGKCLAEVLLSYGLMLVMNLAVNLFLVSLLPDGNPNTGSVLEMAEVEYGKTAAVAVCFAPLTEELIFRGALFGLIRRKSRTAAYAVSMLCFAFYHIWPYALADPVYWLYLLQYLPASWLLCRCYERCNSIWGNIFLHMLINAVSLYASLALSQLL